MKDVHKEIHDASLPKATEWSCRVRFAHLVKQDRAMNHPSYERGSDALPYTICEKPNCTVFGVDEGVPS